MKKLNISPRAKQAILDSDMKLVQGVDHYEIETPSRQRLRAINRYRKKKFGQAMKRKKKNESHLS